MPNRPHLIALDPDAPPAPERPARPRRSLLPWLAAIVVGLGVAGWWLFLQTNAELQRTHSELARSQARVFSLENRMLQLRRGAAALASTLGAAEEQARALESLAVPDEAAARLAHPAPEAVPARPDSDGAE